MMYRIYLLVFTLLSTFQLLSQPMLKMRTVPDSKCEPGVYSQSTLMGGFSVIGGLEHALRNQLCIYTSINALWKEDKPIFYKINVSEALQNKCSQISITDYEDLSIEEIAEAIRNDLGYIVIVSEKKTKVIKHLTYPGLTIRSIEGTFEDYLFLEGEDKNQPLALVHLYYNHNIPDYQKIISNIGSKDYDISTKIMHLLDAGFKLREEKITYVVLEISARR